MHETIAGAIREHLGERTEVRTATLDDPGHGLDDAVLETTDVLTWWGHLFHEDVADDVAGRSSNVCSTGWASSSSTPATCRSRSSA